MTRLSWTPEMDAELREIYATCVGSALPGAIRQFSIKHAITVGIVKYRAKQLGVTQIGRYWRPWSETEDAALREGIGHDSVDFLSRMLGRSYWATWERIKFLRLSAATKRGYSRKLLARCLGIDPYRTLGSLLEKWPIEENSFHLFEESDVEFWVREHLRNLDLRKCDQEWLKKILLESGIAA